MMSERATLPAAAPGEWTKGRSGLEAHEVRVAFPGVRDAAALREQLEIWHAGLQRSGSRAPLIPVVAPDDDGTTLFYPAPRAIGANAIGSQAIGADPMAKYEAGNPKRALWLLSAVAAALDDLHAHGLVHGALTFPSIWWMPDGEVRFPDAALAHALEDIAKASQEVFVYRAPEVWHGGAPLPESDQYSLAVIAYELFTGRSRKDSRTVEGILVVEPLMLGPNALHEAGAPPVMAEVLQRAISASPRARYESCSAFVAAMAAAFEHHEPANRGERRAMRRRRLITPGGVTLVLGAIAAIAGAIALMGKQTEARRMVLSLRDRVFPPFVNPAPTRGGSGGDIALGTRPPTMSRGTIATALDPATGAAVNTVGPPVNRPPGAFQGPLGAIAPGVSPSSGTATSTAAGPVSPRGSAVPSAGAASSGGTLSGSPASAAAIEAAARAARGVGAAVASGSANGTVSATLPAIGAGAPNTRAAQTVPPGAPPTTAGAASRPVSTASGAGKGDAGSPASGPSENAASETQGTIVLTLPAGSRVYVDGVLTRTDARPSPTRTLFVPPGMHDIDVLTPQGASHKRRVTIAARDTARVIIPPAK